MPRSCSAGCKFLASLFLLASILFAVELSIGPVLLLTVGTLVVSLAGLVVGIRDSLEITVAAQNARACISCSPC